MYVIIFLVKVTEWPSIGKIAAHSAYYMFSWYKYLIVDLVFPTSVFWSEIFFLLQKPRWEKTKLTIRYLYHENIS